MRNAVKTRGSIVKHQTPVCNQIKWGNRAAKEHHHKIKIDQQAGIKNDGDVTKTDPLFRECSANVLVIYELRCIFLFSTGRQMDP